jgi:hypothetical protein
MKQLSTLGAAIATFCCTTLLQAQTLDDLINLDALLACECELVLEPVCVDLGVGVTFPAPNACVAECLALPIVEGGDCMTPEALSFWLAYFGVDPEDFGDFEDIEELLEDLLDDYLDEDDDHDHHGDGHHDDDDDDEDDDEEDDDDHDEWDGDWDGTEDEDDDHHGDHDGDWDGDWDGHHHGDSLGVDTLDGDWHHGGDWDGDWDGDHDHDGGCDGDTTSTDSVSTGGALIHSWDLQELLDERRNSNGTHGFTTRDLQEFQIDAFPNPATDFVVAALPEWAEEIRLVSMTGQATSIQRISEEIRTQFDVSGLTPGTYLVVVLGEGLKASTPIVIQR